MNGISLFVFLALLIWAAPAVPQVIKPPAGATKKSSSPVRKKKLPQENLLVTGEVIRARDGAWEIRPWNWRMPRRMNLSRREGAVTYLIERVDRDYLRGDDFVLAAGPAPEPDSASTSGKKSDGKAVETEAQPEKEEMDAPAQPAGPLEIDAVLIFGSERDGPVAPMERKQMRAALAAARGFFIGKRRGGVSAPQNDHALLIGELQRKGGWHIVNEEKSHAVRPAGDVVYLHVRAVDSSQIRPGRTVAALLSRKLKPGEAPEAITADALYITAAPALSPMQERRLILREQGKLKRKAVPGSK